MELAANGVLLFREGGRTPHSPPASKGRRQSAAKAMEAIYCRSCGNAITARDQKIQVNGSHAHTFFNPAGIVFELGCFRLAPGCLTAGKPSPEFTWFPGYVWRVVMCRRCKVHLGWVFAMGEHTFHGLILTKLSD